VTFIDRQLDGDFGKAATQYRAGPIVPGTPQQGPQEIQTPAERYRSGLASLDAHCQASHGQAFADLDEAQQDAVVALLEEGKVAIQGSTAKAFFELVLLNVREGYLADPMYGGNKGMAGWKMIGFPGARYDFRDLIDRRGQTLQIIPTSMIDNSL
jgi:gluconate 2-dehydrogenase gamma chain